MSLFNSANGLTRRKRIGEGDDGEPDVDDESDHDNEYDYRGPKHDKPTFRTVMIGDDGTRRGSDGGVWNPWH